MGLFFEGARLGQPSDSPVMAPAFFAVDLLAIKVSG